jgi:hypothetical protein
LAENRVYASIGLWGLFYKDRDQRTYIKILFTGQDNATIGFFRNKVMDSRKGEIIN